MFQNKPDDPTAVALPEAAQLLRKKTLRLQGPREANVYHPLHHFTQTAG